MVARRTTYGQTGGAGGNAISHGAPGCVRSKRIAKEEFHAEDVTYANAKCGALVLEQVGAIVENSEEQAVYG